MKGRTVAWIATTLVVAVAAMLYWLSEHAGWSEIRQDPSGVRRYHDFIPERVERGWLKFSVPGFCVASAIAIALFIRRG